MPLVLLDRDGVINEDSDNYIRSPDEWLPIPGSIDAIARLSQAGYRIAVVTNQSGLGRGYFSLATLNAMHDKLRALVEAAGGRVDCIVFCPHVPDEQCACRKPKPGLIDQACAALGVDPQHQVLVGDSIKDLQAAVARHCQPILVRTGKGPRSVAQLPDYPELSHTQVFDNLSAFTDALLSGELTL